MSIYTEPTVSNYDQIDFSDSLEFERNPYDLPQAEIDVMIKDMAADPSRNTLLSYETHPDIGRGVEVILIDGSDPRSDAARSFEGKVLLEEWNQPPEQTREEESLMDGDCFFMLYIEQADSGSPVLGASFRVSNPKNGSETVEFYKETSESYRQNGILPVDLDFVNSDHESWELATVVADKEHATGIPSAWLYHAAYELSKDTGVEFWISNIIEKERRNLVDRIGIPFSEIEGTERTTVEQGGKPLEFGFFSVSVGSIYDSVKARIDELAGGKDTPITTRMLNIVNIALLGEINR